MTTAITNRNLAPDATLHTLQGEEYVILDVAEGGTELYRVGSQTRNARALWTADAVIFDGDVLYPALDDIGCIALVHNWAGTQETFVPREWLDTPAWKLTRVSSKQEAKA